MSQQFTLVEIFEHLRRDEDAAIARALAEVRAFWLPIFEDIQAIPSDDPLTRICVNSQIVRLRRQLRLPGKEPDREGIREQTRERVRRMRDAHRSDP